MTRAAAGRCKRRAIISWSSGKDSAWALHVSRQQGEFEVVAALTTVTTAYGRVSMHGVLEEVLEAQADAIGLPLIKVGIPAPCPNEVYERAMEQALDAVRADGVDTVIFGDLFLEDLRAWRESKLAAVGMKGAFPIWRRDTAVLAREMIAAGVRARVVCLDPRRLDPSFAGRDFDHAFLADLPADVDPCGETGEFHTCVCDGPMFRAPLSLIGGEIVTREGFVFADALRANPGSQAQRPPWRLDARGDPFA
jgi:uncharacterized protein (TIGR00290 family)